MLNPPSRPSGVESKGWVQERLEAKAADTFQVTITYPHPRRHFWVDDFPANSCLVGYASEFPGVFFQMFEDGEGWEIRDDISFVWYFETTIFKIDSDVCKAGGQLLMWIKQNLENFQTWRSPDQRGGHLFLKDQSWKLMIHVMLTVSNNPFFLLAHPQSSDTLTKCRKMTSTNTVWTSFSCQGR